MCHISERTMKIMFVSDNFACPSSWSEVLCMMGHFPVNCFATENQYRDVRRT